MIINTDTVLFLLTIAVNSSVCYFLYSVFLENKQKISSAEFLITNLHSRMETDFAYLCKQIDNLYEKTKESTIHSDTNIKNVYGFQEKLADKLHTNVMNLQEIISKMNCETLQINETVYLTKRDLETKIANIINMQEKMILYIQENITELRTICHYPNSAPSPSHLLE